MQAVVPAAGKGTRLRPLTATKPKGLVEINGKALLEYCFEQLVEIGIDEIVVVIGYRGEQIVKRFDNEYEGIPLRHVTQEDQLGLGHAIAQAEPILEDDFIVYNGDNIFGTSLEKVVQTHNQNAFDATILVETASVGEAQRTGVVTLNDDGTVRRLVEKPKNPTSNLITTGIYILPEEIFRHIERTGKSDRGEFELTEAMHRFQNQGGKIGIETHDSWRVNVNTLEDRKRAAERLEE